METGSPDTKKTLIDRLFAAGAHFGFSRSRRHPTVAPYLFTTKHGTDIFDLEKTSSLLEVASTYLEQLGKESKTVLLVGTKEEVSRLVKEKAVGADMPFVTHRWIGGMITNFSEIKKRIDRLTQLKEQMESGELTEKYTKKERLMVSREIEKLEQNFGGIEHIQKLPAAVVVVDPRHESIAVAEATARDIPVVAVMGSDCDASPIDYPVIVNDAHTASVTLALDELVGAYLNGRKDAPTAEATPRA